MTALKHFCVTFRCLEEVQIAFFCYFITIPKGLSISWMEATAQLFKVAYAPCAYFIDVIYDPILLQEERIELFHVLQHVYNVS